MPAASAAAERAGHAAREPGGPALSRAFPPKGWRWVRRSQLRTRVLPRLPVIWHSGTNGSRGSRNVATSTRNENHLLAALSDEEFSPLESWLELISLPRGEVLTTPGADRARVLPDERDGLDRRPDVEGPGRRVATVGNEGMIGLPIYLGAGTRPST